MLGLNSNDGLDRLEKVTAFEIESERTIILLESLPATTRSASLKQVDRDRDNDVLYVTDISLSRNHQTRFMLAGNVCLYSHTQLLSRDSPSSSPIDAVKAFRQQAS